jgi:glucose-6-phosphate dehydrogenase assembly protein OpcA
VADRLVVDGSEWEDTAATYARLAGYFDRVVVSDIAWARLLPWRVALARRWPAIAEASRLSLRGSRADALLLAGWLRARLGHAVELEHEPAQGTEAVTVDGEPVEIVRYEPPTTADLLSDQLEIYSRDPVYEEAVAAVSA